MLTVSFAVLILYKNFGNSNEGATDKNLSHQKIKTNEKNGDEIQDNICNSKKFFSPNIAPKIKDFFKKKTEKSDYKIEENHKQLNEEPINNKESIKQGNKDGWNTYTFKKILKIDNEKEYENDKSLDFLLSINELTKAIGIYKKNEDHLEYELCCKIYTKHKKFIKNICTNDIDNIIDSDESLYIINCIIKNSQLIIKLNKDFIIKLINDYKKNIQQKKEELKKKEQIIHKKKNINDFLILEYTFNWFYD